MRFRRFIALPCLAGCLSAVAEAGPEESRCPAGSHPITDCDCITDGDIKTSRILKMTPPSLECEEREAERKRGRNEKGSTGAEEKAPAKEAAAPEPEAKPGEPAASARPGPGAKPATASPPKKHCVFLADSEGEKPKVPEQEIGTEVIYIPPDPTDLGEFTAWAAGSDRKFWPKYRRHGIGECGFYACNMTSVPCTRAASSDPFQLHTLGTDMHAETHFCNELYRTIVTHEYVQSVRLHKPDASHAKMFDEFMVGGPTDGWAGKPGDYAYSGIQLYLLKWERLVETSLHCDSVQGYTEVADLLFRKIETFVNMRIEKVNAKFADAYAAMPPLPQDLSIAITEHCERIQRPLQQGATGARPASNRAAHELDRRTADLQRPHCDKMEDHFRRFRSLHESQVRRSR